MTIIARFEDGVLKPAQPLSLPPNSEVRVTIEYLSDSVVTAANLGSYLSGLPILGDDAATCADDIRAIRAEFHAETDPWA